MRIFSRFTYLDVVSREQLREWKEPSTRPAFLAKWVRDILDGEDLTEGSDLSRTYLYYKHQTIKMNDFLVEMDGEVVVLPGRLLELFYDVKLPGNRPQTNFEKVRDLDEPY